VELLESIPHSSDINDDVSRNEEVHRLYDAIDTLTAVDKAIILLHLEDQSYDEIASISGLSKSNVSVRLVRIKRALKDHIEESMNRKKDNE
jgi:RNA polymerase sigma-70 factor (ECF subfamily)